MYHSYQSDNPVDFDEFLDYYTYVSALYELDSQFDIMVSNTWNLNSNMNPLAIPYAGISQKITRVNTKERWLNDHHRAIIEGAYDKLYAKIPKQSPTKSMQESPDSVGKTSKYSPASPPKDDYRHRAVYDYQRPAVAPEVVEQFDVDQDVRRYKVSREPEYSTPKKSDYKVSSKASQVETASNKSHQSSHYGSKYGDFYNQPGAVNYSKPTARRTKPKEIPPTHIHSRYY